LVEFIFHKFVRNFTHICEKNLQIIVKLGKPCLVGLAPGLHVSKLVGDGEGGAEPVVLHDGAAVLAAHGAQLSKPERVTVLL
jgi:hypothetical protein